MVTICRTCVLACACLFCWSQAHAGCVIGVPHPTFYVGSDNQVQILHDSGCNHGRVHHRHVSAEYCRHE